MQNTNSMTPSVAPASGIDQARNESGESDRDLATVLIVDDDVRVAEVHRRVLSRAGFATVAVSDAFAALEFVRGGEHFGAIVTDIVMPKMDGVTLLREIRKYDLDVPVVLITGHPTLDTAILALQHGGFRYLAKPFEIDELQRVVAEAVSLHHLARLKREALTLLTSHKKEIGDRASLEVHFELALEQLWIAFQPIVDWKNRVLFGYEALMRSSEPTLNAPELLLNAAERLGKVWDLGRAIRQHVASQIDQIQPGDQIFVNLHPSDLEDPELYDVGAALSQHAHRVILEVTERSSLDELRDIGGCTKKLRALGYRIAVDDLGAGYAGLSCFSRLEPDVAKLDMSLVRGIDTSKHMRSLVQSMISVCNRELGIHVVCEGVETLAERDVLDSLGADLLQGYLFARPGPAFPKVHW